MTGDDLLIERMVSEALGPLGPGAIGIAVSGGGDSMALLHILARLAPSLGRPLAVVTVDHGLRTEAADEARAVAALAGRLGLPHDTLNWRGADGQGWDGQGNLQDQARRARYGLIGEWARRRRLAAVALGHTADDQAETFLMRLARGSGLDGLSCMVGLRHWDGVDWLRPLLAARRDDLRAYLARRGQSWFDDPSNEDPGYDRIRTRRALAALAPAGINVMAICETVGRLQQSRAAVDDYVLAKARQVARIVAGDVVFDLAGFQALSPELRRRLLAHALVWVSSAEYAPRHEAILTALSRIDEARSATLHGCVILVRGDELRILREYQALRDLTAVPGQLWDRRWLVNGPVSNGLHLRALGEDGLRLCPAWRANGLSRMSLLASPSVWREGDLVAAPLAGRPEGWRAELRSGSEDFFSSILSH